MANITIGNKVFQCEVAATYKDREFGLMHRHSLPADQGMIFVFPEEDERSFWMDKTFIPLDILYLNRSGRVVAIRTMKPLDRTAISSEKPAQYAIELNAGAAALCGIQEGDTIQLPPLPKPE